MAPFLGALGQIRRTNRGPRTNEPRTIQEAADAIILHITKMERTLESALSKNTFRIEGVHDLGKLVKLAESLYDHFAREMDAQASFWSLVSNWFTRNRHGEEHKESKSPDSRDAGEEDAESNPHGIAVTESPLVAHGEIRAETLVALNKMQRDISRTYLGLFIGFIRSILGTEREQAFGVIRETDDLLKKVFRILEEAKSSLGEIIDLDQVISAYTNVEGQEQIQKRESAMQLAQFVLGSYDKTLRGKAVSFLGKRNLIKDMAEYAKQAELRYNNETDTHASGSSMREEQKAETKRQTEIDNKTNGEIAEMDHFFKTVRITVRAMEIKTKIHKLVARFDSTKSAEAKLSLYGDFLTILEKEVKPALSVLVKLHNMSKRDDFSFQCIGLIRDSEASILKTKKHLHAMSLGCIEKEPREAEEQRTDNDAMNLNVIELDKLDKRFQLIFEDLKTLEGKIKDVVSLSPLSLDPPAYGSKFGRYVSRAAKRSIKVPARAWNA